MAGSRWFDVFRPWRMIDAPATNSQALSTNLANPPADGSHQEETGVSGSVSFGGILKHEDPNPAFDNFQAAVQQYQKMRTTDAQIQAILKVLKLPLLRATWEAVPPDGGDDVDKEIADFIDQALFDDDAMQDSWHLTLSHVLLMLDYGFSILEVIYRVDDEGRYRVKRLAPRLSPTVRYWWVNRDGTLQAVTQYAPVMQVTQQLQAQAPKAGVSALAPYYRSYASYQYITIEAKDLVVFTHQREGDQYEGQSVLRPLVRNYFYKDQAYHLEGIRLDRWGVGIPTAKLQDGHSLSAAELEQLTDILQRVRSNEKAYLVLPPGVDVTFLPEGTGGNSGAGVTSGAAGGSWVDHHDNQMVRSVLAGFLTMDHQQRGSQNYGSRLTDLFVSSLRGISDGIAGELKRQVVRKLCDLNFDMTNRQYPDIRVRDLDLSDLESTIEVMAKLVPAGILTADDDMETMLRKLLKLPDLPADMSREAKLQQQAMAPAAPGLPPGQLP